MATKRGGDFNSNQSPELSFSSISGSNPMFGFRFHTSDTAALGSYASVIEIKDGDVIHQIPFTGEILGGGDTTPPPAGLNVYTSDILDFVFRYPNSIDGIEIISIDKTIHRCIHLGSIRRATINVTKQESTGSIHS